MQRGVGGRIYYGWIVVGVTALTLITSAGERSVPGVLIHPLELEFGWSTAAISLAVSIGLLLFGLMGPIAGRLMDRSGPRRLMMIGLLLIVVSTATSATMTQLWQLDLLWGVVSGVGTGMAATVLGAAVANRWFTEKRGLVIGIFGGATSAGQLLFVQLNVRLVVTIGWRGAVLVLAGVALLVLIPVLFLMENSPADVGVEPYGGAPQPVAGAAATETAGVMRRALRVPEFWLLAGSFFICGATSNGLIGTHFIAHSIDHGIAQTTAASVLALMGAMNFVGTICSGYLTDRYDPRKLLACYYIFRGLSLFVLPIFTSTWGLAIFAVFFGLDYIATVPPTADARRRHLRPQACRRRLRLDLLRAPVRRGERGLLRRRDPHDARHVHARLPHRRRCRDLRRAPGPPHRPHGDGAHADPRARGGDGGGLTKLPLMWRE